MFLSKQQETPTALEKEAIPQEIAPTISDREQRPPASPASDEPAPAKQEIAKQTSESGIGESPLLKRLQVISATQVSEEQEEVGRTRNLLLETDLKHKWIRYRQEIIPKGNQPKEIESAWVADHYIVHKHASVDEAAFKSTLQERGYDVHLKLSLENTYIISTPPLHEEDQNRDSIFRQLLEQTDLFTHVERDYVQMSSVIDEPELVSGKQWPLDNTGIFGGIAGSDIDALKGWALKADASDVVVAVVDTGVNYFHQDLAANMWSNQDEIPDDGIDNDGNGYIDDLYGIDTYNRDSDPGDDNGHGTHCAGIIGADGNNNFGMTGVAPSVEIMSLKFLSQTGVGFTSDALETIDYAKSKGADILNLSWGSPAYSQLLKELLESCGQDGMIVVAAAGNNADNIDNRKIYPASFDLDNLLTVAATDDTDELAAFSNYGPFSVDMAAPGNNVYSTWAGSSDAYSTSSGTSMAAPHASGALALVRSLHGGEAPFSSIARLLNGAEKLPQLGGLIAQQRRLSLEGALTNNAIPENDSPQTAYASRLHSTHWNGSNLNATVSNLAGASLESCVWFAWTPPTSGRGLIDFDAITGSLTSVFRKDTDGNYQPVFADRSPGRYGLNVSEDQDYLIAVHGDTSGNFTLEASVAPQNDEFRDATTVNGELWRVTGSNLGANLATGESGLNYDSGKSVWWKWTAPSSGALRVDTEGSDFDTILAIYPENPLEGIVQGSAADILLLVDVSGSTSYEFEGALIKDINNDGRTNTVLDAQIAAASNIINLSKELPNPESKTVTLITFDGSAATVDLDTTIPGKQSTIPLVRDANDNGIDDAIEALERLRTGGSTNYESALQAGITTLNQLATEPGNGNVIFFSDGHPTSGGSYSDEVATLNEKQTLIRAFGAGSGASLGSLRVIDPTARLYTNAEELKQMISGALAYNDDHQGKLTSEVNLSVIAGEKYYIRVDGYRGESGTIQLRGNMYDGLEVVTQPSDTQAERGSNAALSVEVRGVAPIQYQWFRNGEYISEAKSATLHLENVTAEDAASYHVRISNTFTSIDSDAATLGVFEDAPEIIKEPLIRSATIGSNVSIDAEVSGTEPLNYQWYKDGEPIPDATAAGFVLTNFQSSDQGSYHLVVTNTAGSAKSTAAYIEESSTPRSDWYYANVSGPHIGSGGPATFHDGYYYFFSAGLAYRTRNGVFWSTHDLPDNKETNPDGAVEIESVATMGNTIVVYATRGFDEWTLFASDDGVNWTEIDAPNIRFYSIAAYGNRWISFGIYEDDFAIMSSEDLETWTKVDAISAYTEHLLVPAGSEWSYLADADPPEGNPSFYDSSFDDSTWPRGHAELGYGDGDETTTIPNAPSNDSVYFRHEIVNPLGFPYYDISGLVKYDGGVTVRVGSKTVFSEYDAAEPEGFEDNWQDIDRVNRVSISTSDTLTYCSAQVFKSGIDDTDLSFDLEIWGRAYRHLLYPVAGDDRIIVMRRDGTVFVSYDGVQWTAEESTGIAKPNSNGIPYVDVSYIIAHQDKFIAWKNSSRGRSYFVSEDGVNWEEQAYPTVYRRSVHPIPLPLDITRLTKADDLLICLGGDTLFYTSDCINWESMVIEPGDPSVPSYETSSVTRLVHNGEEFLAGTGYNEYQRTTSLNDLKRTTNGTKVGGTHLKVINGELVSFRRGPGYYSTSRDSVATTDGETWRFFRGSSPDAVFHNGVYYSLVVGNSTPYKIYRSNGVRSNSFNAPNERDTSFPYAWEPLTILNLNGKFLVAGDKGGIASSDDSINWTLLRPSSDLSGKIGHAKIINGIYFAFAENGEFITSTDGETYTSHTLPGISGRITNGTFGNGKYFVSAENDGQATLFHSSDLNTWAQIDLGTPGDIRGITYAAGSFVAVADQTVLSSTNGETWSITTLPEGSATDVIYYRDRFWISNDGRNIYTQAAYWQSSPEKLLSAPTISEISIDESYLVNSEIIVQADILSAGGTERIDFYLDGTLVKSQSTGPFEWRSSDVGYGTHELVIYAYAADGTQSSSIHTFNVEVSDAKMVFPSPAHNYRSFLQGIDGRLYGYGNHYKLPNPKALGYSTDGVNWKRIDAVYDWFDMRQITDLKQISDGTLAAVASKGNGDRPLYRSKDGKGWEKTFDDIEGQLFSVEDEFLILPALISGRTAYTSNDGYEWIPQRISYDPGNFISVTRSLSQIAFWKQQYVGLYSGADDTGIITSRDGLNWVGQQALPMEQARLLVGRDHLVTFASWVDVTFVYPDYVYTDRTEAYYTVDGSNWHPLSNLTEHDFKRMSAIDGVFYGSDESGLWTSSDLVNWTLVTPIDADNQFLLDYDNLNKAGENFLLSKREIDTDEDSVFQAITSDFNDWQILQDYNYERPTSMASDSQKLVIVCETGLFQSENGRNWTQLNTDIPNPDFIVRQDNVWVIAGYDSTLRKSVLAHSTNLEDWTFAEGELPNYLRWLYFHESSSKWVAVGRSEGATNSDWGEVAVSTNLVNWTLSTGAPDEPFEEGHDKISEGLVSVNQKMVLFRDSGYFFSDDGINWQYTAKPGYHAAQQNMFFEDNTYYIPGANPHYRSSDLINWEQINSPLEAPHDDEAVFIGDIGLGYFDPDSNDLQITTDGGQTFTPIPIYASPSAMHPLGGLLYSIGIIDYKVGVLEFSLVDLIPENLEVTSAGTPGIGLPITVDFEIVNKGYIDYDVARDLSFRILLSPDADFTDGNNFIVYEDSWSGTLTKDARMRLSREFNLPRETPSGELYLAVEIDEQDILAELNEENNFAAMTQPAFTLPVSQLTVNDTVGGRVQSGSGGSNGLAQSNNALTTLSGETQLPYNTLLNLVPKPDKGYAFVGWEEFPNAGIAPLHLTLTSDYTLTPMFRAVNDVNVLVTGQGSIQSTPLDLSDLADGEMVSLTAIPAEGWTFLQWSGDHSDDQPATSLTAAGAQTIRATFYKNSIDYEYWRTQQFNIYKALDKSYSDNAVDADGDNYENLLEYLFCTDAEDSSSQPAIKFNMDDQTVTFEHTTDPRISDYSLELQYSNDLNEWHPVNATREIAPIGYKRSKITNQIQRFDLAEDFPGAFFRFKAIPNTSLP